MGAVLVSSREGYFANVPDAALKDGGLWRVTKRRFDAEEGTTEDVWHRDLDPGRFGGRLFVSDNGRWLGVSGWEFHVLETDTGRTVFQYSKVAPVAEHVARLGTVVGDEGAAAVGRLGSITFRGDSMMFFREFGRLSCHTPPGEEYDAIRGRQCMKSLREYGHYHAVLDVYDLNAITLDAQPTYRAEVYLETSCMERSAPLPGLQAVSGRLIYASGP